MAEDTVVTPPVDGVNTEVDNEDVVVAPPAPEYGPQEIEAMQEGWTPKDQWKGDPKDWRPADQWLDRGQFMRTISQLRGEIRKQEVQVSEAYKVGQRIAEAQYNEKLQELKATRRQALHEGDLVTADKVEDQIDSLKENKAKPVDKPVSAAPPPPEYDVFLRRNPAYLTNSVFQHTANAIGAEYIKMHPNAAPADFYLHVENQMKTNFPQHYGGRVLDNKVLPATEGGGQSGSRSGNGLEHSLASAKQSMNETERGIMKTMIKTGVFKSEADFLKEYVKAPGRG